MAKGKSSATISQEIHDLVKRLEKEYAAKINRLVAEGHTVEEAAALLKSPPSAPAPRPALVRSGSRPRDTLPDEITVIVGGHVLRRLGRGKQILSSSVPNPVKQVEQLNRTLRRGELQPIPRQLNSYRVAYEYGTVMVLKPKPGRPGTYYGITYKSDFRHRRRGHPVKIHYELRGR